MRFVFCLHNHQPEGTFPDTLEECYRKAYWPTLRTIAEHPSIRVVLHNSGCLLENLLLGKPEYMELLTELVGRGQVEILSSPIYEPILPTIPEFDQVAQIRAHQDLLERTFGVVPRGMWLAERVWEPSLPRVMAQAGIEYLPLDDTAFLRVGILEKRLFDSYVTEDQGMPVRVFPVPQSLRQLIPFARPEEVIGYLIKRHGTGARIAVFADDGEKFGVWPGTHESVQQQRWLSRFFALLEQEQHRIQTCTLAEFVDGSTPSSNIYLPTGAHTEILEWSIPPGPQRRHYRLRTRLVQEADGLDRMLGMGYWRNFLVRYPEANWMHKRGLDLSRRLRRCEEAGADPEMVEAARRHLWKAQCNSAYWHGVSGGVYLPHLRAAVHANLLAAWRLMDRIEHGDGSFVHLSHRDIDLDGSEEVVIENRELALTLAPGDGGTLVALDLKSPGINLLDIVARREEAYHKSIREQREDGRGGKAGPAHQAVRGRRENVAAYLNYDPFPLYSLRDHFLPERTTVKSIQELRTLSSPPARTRMAWEREGPGRVRLRGAFRLEDRNVDLERLVVLDADQSRFRAHWLIALPDGLSDRSCEFATELTLGLQSVPEPGWTVETAPGARRGAGEEEEAVGVSQVVVENTAMGLRVVLSVEPAVRVLRYPVETVSLAESGAECVFQGTRIFLAWPLEMTSRRFECILDVIIER